MTGVDKIFQNYILHEKVSLKIVLKVKKIDVYRTSLKPHKNFLERKDTFCSPPPPGRVELNYDFFMFIYKYF